MTSSLASPTQYLITLNLGTTGVPITPCSKKIWFQLHNNKSSSVNITHPIKRNIVTPIPRRGLCPSRCGGDKEFKGHGPKVKAHAVLFIKNNNSLWVEIYLHAKETTKDHTCASGKWTYPVWETPNGFHIVYFSPKGASRAEYVDNNHQLDIPSITGSALVSKFEIMGDTGGDDTGNCTADDVYINVYFKPVKINYKRVCGM